MSPNNPPDDRRPLPPPEPTVTFGAFRPGTTQGGRYRIEGLLGRGGMGEVWQAYDLKLCVDVALKRLHPELLSDSKHLELIRREVRAARDVASPHVCRVFDLVEIEGQELLSMEYIDGSNLNELLERRGPLELAEASEIAGQLLAGLEAIHQVGLVHRDLKPANVMITRAGRVVVMDFGIAKAMPEAGATAAGPGTIAGTPAYMAPEQTRGEELDARADIFAAGVVLAEMLGVQARDPQTTREQLWRSLRQQPPQIPEGPWKTVLAKAVSSERKARFASARDLARGLEELTQRAEGMEDVTPYPGLSFFTEADARYFFGRELEVEATWKKLHRVPMLAVLGPSGVGKSSFLRAGLLPALPEGWRAIICTPETAPLVSLARALTPELAGDTEAMLDLVRFAEPDVAVGMFKRWRSQNQHCLVVVDQGEELFTLNPPEVQEKFAELLGRLTVEADVHVVFSMRDDFFFHCHRYSALAPLFSNSMPVGPLTGEDLRRALVQPALLCGYRFEDESLIDEMLEPIADERGALPLLAFAASRLWEKRDRTHGQITRQAFEEIGKVGGALAQHAEMTLERISTEHLNVVREIFRNLVTAQGTRVVRDRDQLLSVFEDQKVAGEVLQELIDARLLTSFEVAADDGEEGETRRRVEVIHESLLTSWPRLVRWQTQDADGAQLRDQLNQAAQLWEQRSRSDDLLWTGTAYQEFELWRERYPGGLTATEEGFAEAMQARDRRRRRRRRWATAAAFTVLSVVLIVVGVFWQRAVQQAWRAEASRLLAEGRMFLEENNSKSLAYAIASLEVLDSPEARRFAIEALWKGPTEFPLPDSHGQWALDFSPDGHWLAELNGGVYLRPSDGGEPRKLEWNSDSVRKVSFHRDRPWLLGVSQDPENSVRVWSVPDGELVIAPELGGYSNAFWGDKSRTLLTATADGPDLPLLWRSWSLESWEPTVLGTSPGLPREWFDVFRGRVDPGGNRFLDVREKDIRIVSLHQLEDAPAGALLAALDERVVGATFDPTGDRAVSIDGKGKIQLWSSTPGSGTVPRTVGHHDNAWALRFANTGSILATASHADGTICIWDLTGPPEADPIVLRKPGNQVNEVAFHPSGRWVAAVGAGNLRFWPLTRAYPLTLRGHTGYVAALVFDPAGRWLASDSLDGTVRVWSLSPGAKDAAWTSDVGGYSMAMDDQAEKLILGGVGFIRLLSRSTGQVIRELGTEQVFEAISSVVSSVALGPGARLAAATGSWDQDGAIGIWDLDADRFWTVDAGDSTAVGVNFTPDGRLLAGGDNGLRLWDVEAGTHEILREGVIHDADVSGDGQTILSVERSGVFVLDRQTGESIELTAHRGQNSGALDPTGEWVVTGSFSTGEIRYGPVTGEEAHLLVKHAQVGTLEFDPQGRWIASGGMDGTIRLWPIPTGQPFHTLPYEEFVDRLRTLTNIRVVPDEEGGYEFHWEPFLGWAEAQTW